jgi:hypothetical protein
MQKSLAVKTRILFIFLIFSIYSCKEKCYHCSINSSNPRQEFTACKDDPRYDNIKNGIVYTDINGAAFVCEKK